jgi:hypothetical protein
MQNTLNFSEYYVIRKGCDLLHRKNIIWDLSVNASIILKVYQKIKRVIVSKSICIKFNGFIRKCIELFRKY